MPLALRVGGENVDTAGAGCWVLAYEWSHAPAAWAAAGGLRPCRTIPR